MNATFSELRRSAARWRVEHDSVAGSALIRNLERIGQMCAVMAVVNGLHVLVFLYQLIAASPKGLTYRWAVSLLVLHFLMGLSMVAFAALARRWMKVPHEWPVRMLPMAVVGVSMVFSIAVVTVDQWVTPNITPFLVASTALGLIVYMRPVHAAIVYTLSCLAFAFALGLTQAQGAQLLSNRVNGLAICMMGWALSMVMWRQYTLLTMQQQQLTRVNGELQQKQRDLERLTRQDGLTGLFNRNTFVELSKRELDRAQRQGSATAILLLDLDHFKLINDTWGHPAGDAVLRHVALVASATVRSTDLVGRLGGEEFVVLLPATSREAARQLAEKLRSRLQSSPTVWESNTIAVTASIGLAGTLASEKRSFDALYNEADKALYIAKLRGRNRVEP